MWGDCTGLETTVGWWVTTQWNRRSEYVAKWGEKPCNRKDELAELEIKIYPLQNSGSFSRLDCRTTALTNCMDKRSSASEYYLTGQDIPRLLRKPKFITVFTTARHGILPSASWVYSTPSPTTYLSPVQYYPPINAWSLKWSFSFSTFSIFPYPSFVLHAFPSH
jgi:hypothetical protein